MPYTKNEWFNKSENNRTPITAEKLNHMEKGIEDAFIEIENLDKGSKEYADNNILYFEGEAKYTGKVWTNIFKLPIQIDPSKYLALVSTKRTQYIRGFQPIPYDVGYSLYSEGVKGLAIEISSDGTISYYDEYSGTETFKFLFVPVNKAGELINLT